MNALANLVQYPFDAEGSSFFAALSSACLPALGISERTPYWCSPKGAYCTDCGACSEKTTLQRHQLALYHSLLASSGVAFGFEFPEDDTVEFHSLPGVETGWRWPDEFVDNLMRLAGLTWRRLSGRDDQDAIYEAVRAAVNAGYPAIARLNGELDWQIVSGYGDGALIGLDSRAHTLRSLPNPPSYAGDLFMLADWHSGLIDMILITGRRAREVSFREILERIAATLAHPSHAALAELVNARIDAASPENAADVAAFLCFFAAYPIEARWHAAEAFGPRDSLLSAAVGGAANIGRIDERIFLKYLADNSDETHGVCWKIWNMLGFGPGSDYQPAPNRAELLLAPGVRDELKRLFKIVFDNDTAVLAALNETIGMLR